MSYKRLGSWGRTRRPKGLWNNATVPSKETPAAVSVCTASADLLDDLDSIAHPKVNGYITENQRYLHVYVDDLTGTDNDLSVYIYGYNYAFGKWAPILEQDGDGTRSIMTAACGTSGVAQHYIFDIAGVDRVAFVKTATAVPDNVYAACATF